MMQANNIAGLYQNIPSGSNLAGLAGLYRDPYADVVAAMNRLAAALEHFNARKPVVRVPMGRLVV